MSPTRLFIPLALSLLAACATQPKHNVTVEKQSECPVRLTNGQNLIVMLPSNPTTGYRWAIQDSAGGVLRALSPEVYSNPEDAGVVGAAGPVDLALSGLRPRHRAPAPDLATAVGTGSVAGGNL